MKLVDVFVPGKARTKGSWGPLFIAGEGRAEWERQVAEAAGADMTGTPRDGSVWVTLLFFLPRQGKALAPIGHQTGDIDKLTRLVLDALKTGGVYADDSRVVVLRVVKAWADDEIPPGVLINVYALENDTQQRIARNTARWTIERQGLTEETGY